MVGVMVGLALIEMLRCGLMSGNPLLLLPLIIVWGRRELAGSFQGIACVGRERAS